MSKEWKNKVDTRVKRVGLVKWRWGVDDKILFGLYKRKQKPAADQIFFWRPHYVSRPGLELVGTA